MGQARTASPSILRDVWPSTKEIHDLIAKHVTSTQFKSSYAERVRGRHELEGRRDAERRELHLVRQLDLREESALLRRHDAEDRHAAGHHGARVLAMLGDSVTTDHISPAGNIAADSPAGQVPREPRRDEEGLQLVRRAARQSRGHGARHVREHPLEEHARAGHRRRLTMHVPSGEQMSIYDASMKYQAERTPLMILAGKEYGAGSSRDWAAKGTALLGVQSRDRRELRAHPPLEPDRHGRRAAAVLRTATRPTSLGSRARETFDIEGLGLAARAKQVQSPRPAADGKKSRLQAHRAHRHAEGAGLLHPRRHPAVRAAPARVRQAGGVSWFREAA